MNGDLILNFSETWKKYFESEIYLIGNFDPEKKKLQPFQPYIPTDLSLQAQPTLANSQVSLLHDVYDRLRWIKQVEKTYSSQLHKLHCCLN